MRVKPAWIITLACAGATTTSAAVGEEDASQTYRLQAIRHRFFLHQSSELESEDSSQSHSWNLPFSSEAALVMVDLSGPRFPMPRAGSLELSAVAGGKQLTHVWLPLQDSFAVEGERTTVPFLIHGLACEPVRLAVTLRVGGKRQTLTKTIPLACGE